MKTILLGKQRYMYLYFSQIKAAVIAGGNSPHTQPILH